MVFILSAIDKAPICFLCLLVLSTFGVNTCPYLQFPLRRIIFEIHTTKSNSPDLEARTYVATGFTCLFPQAHFYWNHILSCSFHPTGTNTLEFHWHKFIQTVLHLRNVIHQFSLAFFKIQINNCVPGFRRLHMREVTRRFVLWNLISETECIKS